MANEIHADYASGNTLYAVIRNGAGQVWHPTVQVFEDWGTAGRDADDYDVTLADKSGNRHVGSFDGNVPAGTYFVQVFLQAGAAPADTDALVTSREIIWTGAGVVTAAKILANRAVHDKINGVYKYYDDDGQTLLLTHSAGETASEVTRTPT
jgi:hypothetical protein